MHKSTTAFMLLSMCNLAAHAQMWVGIWAASPIGEEVNAREVSPANLTYRNTVHVSLGGEYIRVLLTNELGRTPLIIGAAHAAMSGGGDGSIQLALTGPLRSAAELP